MRTIALVLAAALLGPASWAAPQAPQAPSDDPLRSPTLRVDWPEFKRLFDAGAAVIVDVRERVSFEAMHIPGARSIPLEEIERHAAELKRLKKPVLLYCA